jgi:hypothetical protein
VRASAAVRYRGQRDTDRSIVPNYFYFYQRLEKFKLNGIRRNLGSVPITVKELSFTAVTPHHVFAINMYLRKPQMKDELHGGCFLKKIKLTFVSFKKKIETKIPGVDNVELYQCAKFWFKYRCCFKLHKNNTSDKFFKV